MNLYIFNHEFCGNVLFSISVLCLFLFSAIVKLDCKLYLLHAYWMQAFNFLRRRVCRTGLHIIFWLNTQFGVRYEEWDGQVSLSLENIAWRLVYPQKNETDKFSEGQKILLDVSNNCTRLRLWLCFTDYIADISWMYDINA